MKKIIFHIPHDGNDFVDELMQSLTIPKNVFEFYHNKMRDTGATLFAPPYPNSNILKFNVSRLLCDVERFPGSEEIMEKYGMGYCYEKVFDGTAIKKISTDIKEKTFQLYSEHHKKLDDLVQDSDTSLIIVDLHSFSEELIVHQTLSEALPDVCIGYDDYLSDEDYKMIASSFERYGFSVKANYPYGGSLVPNCIYSHKVHRDCISFMVEVNKECYIRNGVLQKDKIDRIQTAITDVLDILSSR